MVISFGGGYYLRQPTIKTDIKTEVRTEVIEKIVTVTKKPDGTIIETVAEKKSNKASKVKEPVSTNTYRPDYSLGVLLKPKFDGSFNYQSEVGYRLLGNMWAIALYDFETRAVGIGLRADF